MFKGGILFTRAGDQKVVPVVISYTNITYIVQTDMKKVAIVRKVK
ncbi:MAG: hypothetical protein OIN87_05955 [Candidatus Methanoperedens sp.]|nr:hypothetical protein [Candidatus Methanoperedens sp.]